MRGRLATQGGRLLLGPPIIDPGAVRGSWGEAGIDLPGVRVGGPLSSAATCFREEEACSQQSPPHSSAY